MFACCMDNVIDFCNTNPLDSRLLGGECYTPRATIAGPIHWQQLGLPSTLATTCIKGGNKLAEVPSSRKEAITVTVSYFFEMKPCDFSSWVGYFLLR